MMREFGGMILEEALKLIDAEDSIDARGFLEA